MKHLNKYRYIVLALEIVSCMSDDDDAAAFYTNESLPVFKKVK